ncbi:excisionase family DNA-binding protein [Cohnella abietis]|uniref:Helix-turn-helix domain-containing protein n=1 Tax=Cohnella abietis TaxID=2507935 RepID=A0A3T1D2W9_9BACL|nr:excisionase family DNA-binding protein [Cohnella abietis]BBI32452.1 hypothetical protein KCTCHS21_18510 [Cohnella abietis]
MNEQIFEYIRQEVARQVAEATKVKRATMSAEEAAVYIGVSIDSLMLDVHAKKVPFVMVRRRYLFTQSGLDEWMSEQARINSGRAS